MGESHGWHAEMMMVKVTNNAGNQTPAQQLDSAVQLFRNRVEETLLSTDLNTSVYI